MQSVFITGASGFVGRHVVLRMLQSGVKNIYCLSRSQSSVAEPAAAGVHQIRGSLFDTSLYAHELAQSECVMHLAAATGRASPEEHFRVNLEGTRILLEECRRNGVRHFLHVSTIAVRFADKKRYPYAQAKEQAEELVRKSGQAYTIVRPTMVFGEGSPVLEGLARLAALPVIPVFGDGATRVQPIDVADLANLLATMVDTSRFRGETLELGGPQVLTMNDLLKMIALLRRDTPPRMMHLPMGLLLPVFSALETFLYDHLPFTVGQLATFRFDGVAAKNPLWEEHQASLKSPGAMLGAAFTHAGR